MKVTIKDFAAWAGSSSDLSGFVSGVKIDSRLIEEGDAFFALAGERVNGENYAFDALAKGASLVFVSKDFAGEDERIIKLDDVQYGLQEAALHYRQTLNVKVLAITGSVGKTTIKEIVSAVLSQKYKVFATKGNFNNELGLPLMIFSLDDSYQWAVLEMGMSAFGELERLVQIARPTIAMISNIGTAHIEFFGSREAIAKAKLEITNYLGADDYLILNANDDILNAYRNGAFHVIKVGKEQKIDCSNVLVNQDGTSFDFNYKGQAIHAELNLYGSHHAENALLAIAAADILDLSLAELKAGLGQVKVPAMRFEFVRDLDLLFINDAYNASYDSIIASLNAFKALGYQKECVILGDVLESGSLERELHIKIARALANYDLSIAIFVGKAMRFAYDEYKGEKYYFETYCGVATLLRQLEGIDAVLLKGSRGLALEHIISDYRSGRIECSN